MKNAYMKARANGSRAAHAIAIARQEIEARGYDFPRYLDESVTLDLPRGECIEMMLAQDWHADICERFNAEVDHRPDRDPRAEGAPDWWQDRDGTFYVMGDRHSDRCAIAFDCGDLVAYYRSVGMARHDAFLAARAGRERIARAFRAADSDGYVGFIVTLKDAAGEEIEQESLWGMEASGDYPGREALDAALAMMRDRARYWIEQESIAREDMRSARQAFRALAHEYRAASKLGPNVCDAIRARLEQLKAKHHAAVQVVAS